jgi:hypothetical protein
MSSIPRLAFPGIILCIFMLMVGRRYYGKPLLYLFYVEAFSERLNKF